MVKIVYFIWLSRQEFFLPFLKKQLEIKVKMIQNCAWQVSTMPDYGLFTVLLIRIFLCASKMHYLRVCIKSASYKNLYIPWSYILFSRNSVIHFKVYKIRKITLNNFCYYWWSVQNQMKLHLNIIFSIKHYYGNYFYLLILQLYIINSNRSC